MGLAVQTDQPGRNNVEFGLLSLALRNTAHRAHEAPGERVVSSVTPK